jgi:site-specific DNA-methyltransferase (adenine-specific)
MLSDRVILGDCTVEMQTFPEDSIDCIVTDPPYGLNFMGKAWDKALPPKEAFREMCRVLKPGALAFVMSSPRQDLMWRMAQLLEESGFELGQSFISWG